MLPRDDARRPHARDPLHTGTCFAPTAAVSIATITFATRDRLNMPHTPDRDTATPRTGDTARGRRPTRRAPSRGAVAASVLATALTLGLAACGGSSSTPTASTPTATAPVAVAIHATLTAPTHTPKVNAPWHYVVRVTNGAGHPVSAVVHLQALFQGAVVGQIGLHTVGHGVWSETITWPPASVGQALVFQVLATALGSTVTINYPLQVAPA